MNMQQEQKFARALANPAKSIREKTISELKKYLISVENISDLEMLTLWKALFYCLSVCDRQSVYEELCAALVDLLSVFKKLSFAFHKYLRLFFRALLLEWALLDQNKQNKFYTLLRTMITKCFSLLQVSDWHSKSMSIFLDVIDTEVLHNPLNGPRFHLCDIYLPALLDVTRGNIPSNTFRKLLKPFRQSLHTIDDAHYCRHVKQCLFRAHNTSSCVTTTSEDPQTGPKGPSPTTLIACQPFTESPAEYIPNKVRIARYV